MGIVRLDTLGMISPEPMLKLAVLAPDMSAGQVLEIVGDSPTFEKDIRSWCDRLRKSIVYVKQQGEYKKLIAIQF
ncbi:MAG: sulfurtransferase TusA family protein [Spirochaetales bacterium]|nr:sulfurtransferase TusA family protein [Spirochaetales bacterium]